ncbi:MAG: ATP-dependent Clp protease proteolytic subunit [Myxococcota bacterium]
MMRRLAGLFTLAATLLTLGGADARALELTQRQVRVGGVLTVGVATKIADKLITLDTQADAPVHVMITATDGSAQGVMIVADTIRSLASPVVAVVVTQVHGAGAALAPFADRVVVYPSGGLVFTEVAYEGVEKPEPPPEPKEGEEPPEVKEPTPQEAMLQEARADYLERFYGRLATRIRMDDEDLRAKIEQGGFALTARDAVDRGIAYAVVDRIRYTHLPEIKVERKEIVHEKTLEAVDEDVPDEGEPEARSAQ